MPTPHRAADEISVDTGTGRPATRDARHAGPAHPAGRLTVTAPGRRPRPDCPGDADPAAGQLPVTGLVIRAGNGDKQAWDALVERYAPLIWSICRRHRLDDADADDVSQSVWLRLVDQLDRIRDPAALPGWLATTTRRECSQLLRTARRPHPAGCPPDIQKMPDEHGVTAEQELLAAEAHAALREALSHLPPRDQQLIAALTQDPPLPYAQISARLGIPVGSIGPSRRRCLDKIRRHPAIAALINPGTGTAPGELPDQKRAGR
jgi:RNA polymerase sigma factor (sigma-70 family)